MTALLMSIGYQLQIFAIIYSTISTIVYGILFAILMDKGRKAFITAIGDRLSWYGIAQLTVYVYALLIAFNKI